MYTYDFKNGNKSRLKLLVPLGGRKASNFGAVDKIYLAISGLISRNSWIIIRFLDINPEIAGYLSMECNPVI